MTTVLEHLVGPSHGLDEAFAESLLAEYDEAAVHMTWHGAPYPPLVAHEKSEV